MAKSILSGLTLSETKVKATDLLGKRKEKLINNLGIQKQLAEGLIKNEPVTIYKEKWTKSESGKQDISRIPRKVNKWFNQISGTYFLTPRIGTAKLELAKGMTSIEVGDKANLPSVIDTLIEAIKAGELDKQIESAETAFSKK